MFNGDIMSKKKKNISEKTDPRLAPPFPTGESSEFVPLPADSTAAPSPDSADNFDFIPAPKQKKYGK